MSGRRGSVTLLAGWLFADLLLGLTIIMLGAQAPPPVPAKPVAGKGTATPSPSPSPSPSPCARQITGVSAKPVKVSFRVSPGASDAEMIARVKRELRKHKKHLAGRHAGMVLTFGANGGAGDGVHLATRVNAAARKGFPGIFQTAATRNFHDLAAPSGSISMEIYFVSDSCSPTPES
ncbi:hypothetical protein [Sphaerimonospora thailandensis]|uniref:Uncharacterized protein n=1 Tax=Sphaerimonospora thailandensis TaxID=795644 RepID=A0A8J3VWV6_9ACTN|nr:hypothetical protein [Sphaerimonospora thailandensis]GIH67757.1 hypothetical protein Mth01_00100 [Sphaerimonospora thailandensis]